MQYQSRTGPLQINPIPIDQDIGFFGSKPDQARLFLNLQASLIPPINTIAVFSPEMVTIVNDKPRLSSPQHIQPTLIQAIIFAFESALGSQVDSKPRLTKPPQFICIAQESHQPERSDRPEMFTGYGPSKPQYLALHNVGSNLPGAESVTLILITQPVDIDALFGLWPQKVVGGDLPKLFLAPRIPGPDSQVAHQPETACKAEEIQGNHPDLPRIFLVRQSYVVATLDQLVLSPEMFAGVAWKQAIKFNTKAENVQPIIIPEKLDFLLLSSVNSGNKPDQPRIFKAKQIPLPTGDENGILYKIPADRIEMFQGSFPQLVKRYPYKPIVYTYTPEALVAVGVQIGSSTIVLATDAIASLNVPGGFNIGGSFN